MANSLNRNLKTGDHVVMQGGEEVTLGASSCFGMFAFTIGSAIEVCRPGNKSGLRASGHDIDAAATMEQCAAKNGWGPVPSTP